MTHASSTVLTLAAAYPKTLWSALAVLASAIYAWAYSFVMKLQSEPATEPLEAPKLPVEPVSHPEPTPPAFDFSTPKNAYHSVRVICDENGLTVDQKNLICACIYQESQFYNYLPNGKPVTHDNGTSCDWGICQINDYWHVKRYQDFSSAEDIMENPEKAVRFMVSMFKAGQLKQWVSYSSGAYKQWLQPQSPMWALKG